MSRFFSQKSNRWTTRGGCRRPPWLAATPGLLGPPLLPGGRPPLLLLASPTQRRPLVSAGARACPVGRLVSHSTWTAVCPFPRSLWNLVIFCTLWAPASNFLMIIQPSPARRGTVSRPWPSWSCLPSLTLAGRVSPPWCTPTTCISSSSPSVPLVHCLLPLVADSPAAWFPCLTAGFTSLTH